jgi:hypothetical protein
VPHRQPLALDHVLPRGGHVEEEVDEVVLEQVDLVHVEEAAVGAGEEPRLVDLLAVAEGALEVERADQPVLGGAEREVDHGHLRLAGPARGTGALAPVALVAAGAVRGRVAPVAAALGDRDRREDAGQRPHRRGLRRAAVPEDEHAAHGRVHRRDEQGGLHLVLPDDRGEGEARSHVGASEHGRTGGQIDGRRLEPNDGPRA